MKTKLGLCVLTLTMMIGGRVGQTQPARGADPLVGFAFEDGVAGWVGFGDNAKVSLAQGVEAVKNGTGALRFDYGVAPQQINALFIPLEVGSLATLQNVSFWVRPDHNASLVLAFNEQGGGRFASFFSVKKDVWQKVELTPADFVLLTGPDDPQDANGKLDLDRVEALAFADFDQITAQFAGGATDPILKLLNFQPGPRSFSLDDLTLSAKPLPKAEATPNVVDIDTWEHPQVGWITVGDVALSRVAGEAGAPNALKADYKQASNRITALVKTLPLGLLRDTKRLTFNVASLKKATLVVQVEERGGGKYNTIVEVPTEAEPKAVDVAFADFKPSDDSKDANTQLDLDQIERLVVVDLSGLFGIGEGNNTLWLDSLRAR